MTAAGPKVFVVDDDPSVRKGPRVPGARTVCRPVCLVLDVRMPGLTGLALQEALAAVGRRLSIVFVTGHVDVPMSVKAMKGGAVDLLTKPVDDTRGCAGRRCRRRFEARGDDPMASDSPEILRDRGRSLEEEFFRREDQRLIERRKELNATEVTREALAKASGLTSTEVLDKLIALGIRAETVTALSVVPLVEVAWADGTLDPKERGAVLDRAHEAGIASGSAAHGLLEAWLDRRPDRALLTAWTHFVEGMCRQLSADEAARMKSALLERARTVARASGGIFSKISSAEAGVLAELERAFSATGGR